MEKRTLVNFKTKRDVRTIEEDKMLLCVRSIGKMMLLN